MFGAKFFHLLSYGAADQHTVRELRGAYDGLLVPGTVAAFQREGTGGFVLTLSASEARTPYVIDPRSPLFQQVIDEPKKSHVSLRGILGLPADADYVKDPAKFGQPLVEEVANNWAQFNCHYQAKAGAKFEKYAKRLGTPDLKLETASAPELVLAPYFVANELYDPWWDLSSRLHAATRAAVARLAPGKPCVRVVATEDAGALSSLLSSLEEAHLFVWVSDLNEAKASVGELTAYGRAIRDATARGQSLVALYGGFFAVLLATVGLRGVSHGIGYGEHRNWIELPQSGPPPARYYLPEAHCYVRPELADVLWGAQVTRCDCPVCKAAPPILLEYHDLMMHSVHCRAQEIRAWQGLSSQEAAARLVAEHKDFASRLKEAEIKQPFKEEAARHAEHVPRWIAVLREI